MDELRAAIAAVPPPPPEMAGLLAKVRDRAYTVTDTDVEELKARFSEDEIFEQVVAVAIGEGLRRFDRATGVIGKAAAVT